MIRPVSAYADRISVASGERIRCCAGTSTGPRRAATAAVVRLRRPGNQLGQDRPDFDVVEELGGVTLGPQAVYPGSYLVSENPLQLAAAPRLVIEFNFFATSPGERCQVLASCADDHAGLVVLLDGEGCLAARVGDGNGAWSNRVLAGYGVAEARWYRAKVVYTHRAASLRLGLYDLQAGERVSEDVFSISPLPSSLAAPVAFGACLRDRLQRGWRCEEPFDGRLEYLEVVAGEPDQGDSSTATWDLGADLHSWTIPATSGVLGSLVAYNLPRRAVCGSAGAARDNGEPSYTAIHLFSDALEDCQWQPCVEWRVPENTASGCYAFHLALDGYDELVPFTIRPARTPGGTATGASVALLLPTLTYMAYCNWRLPWEMPIQEMLSDRAVVLGSEEQYLLRHPELGLSNYEHHRDGSDVCHVSWRRPNLNMRPGHCSMEGFTTDLHLVWWLNEQGYHYEVITDHDLDAEGEALLTRYRVVISGSHPEYSTRRMWRALRDYQHHGGRFMYLGGNGFFWHVAISRQRPWIMESRKWQVWESSHPCLMAESRMAETGEEGGMMAACGMPSGTITGTTMSCQGFDHGAPFHRTPESRAADCQFIFDGVAADEVIGDFGVINGGAAAQEWDCIADPEDLPAGAVRLASATEFSPVTRLGAVHARIAADMVYFSVPGGGAVFSAPSMSWCASLTHRDGDNNVSRITANVLDRFLRRDPLPPEGV